MRVVITGGLSGIGLAMARCLVAQGHEVHVTSRSPRSTPGLTVHGLDLNSEDSIKAFAEALGELKIDLFINNAGNGVLGPLTELSRSQVRGQFEANVIGPLDLISRLLPNLKGGHLVIVSSISPDVGLPFGGAYTASKAAMNSVSDILRLELAHLGIRVTTIRPGLLKTNFAQNADRSLKMKEGSSFLRFRESILRRAQLSEEGTDPDEFAAYICPKLLSPRCPSLIHYGKGAKLWPLISKLLPRDLKHRVLLKKFELI